MADDKQPAGQWAESCPECGTSFVSHGGDETGAGGGGSATCVNLHRWLVLDRERTDDGQSRFKLGRRIKDENVPEA